jgi:lipopolysaccharide transport system ATP-binding protein
VSFEVKRGEVIGIIGRNGAGKSTLLKILSRITEPTGGRVTLHGRVACLLEVGTGFHPELTGRENIFLNGAILGMTQREIRKQFDEIVEFAEVEKFLDTPVKHYSSGMHVRLAFAVAAHLKPEILIVDEVLAVGDNEFQKKCLGKMDEISRKQGRTVLFVSHNMETILKLCTRGIFFEAGHIRTTGDIKAVVSAYAQSEATSPSLIDLSRRTRSDNFTAKARLNRATPSEPGSSWSLPFGQQLSLNLSIDVQTSLTQVEIAIGVHSIRGFEIASWSNKCSNVQLPVHPGVNTFSIAFQDLRLLPGQYFLGIAIRDDRDYHDYIPDAVRFEIITSSTAAEIGAQNFSGAVVPDVRIGILD